MAKNEIVLHDPYSDARCTSDITRHIQTTKEANTYQQTPADVNRHFQASAILKQHLGGSGDVRECLLVQLVSVDFN